MQQNPPIRCPAGPKKSSPRFIPAQNRGALGEFHSAVFPSHYQGYSAQQPAGYAYPNQGYSNAYAVNSAMPGLPGSMDPQQMAYMQSQMTPENMMKAQILLSNPAVRAKVMEMAQLAQQGKLTPDMVREFMANVQGLGANGMAGNDDIKALTGSQLIQVGLISSLLGLGSGWAVSRFMNGIHEAPPGTRSWLERTLRGIESIPGVSYINNWLNPRLNAPATASSLVHHLDGALTSDQVRNHFFQSFFGPTGHFAEQAQTAFNSAIPTTAGYNATTVLQRLQGATTLQGVKQVLEADPLHFIPTELHTSITNIAGNAKPGFFARLMGGGTTDAANRLTLGTLDNWLAQHELVKRVESQFAAHALNPADYNRLTRTLGTAFGEGFEANLRGVLSSSASGEVRAALANTLGIAGGGAGLTYEAVITAIKGQAGRQSLTQLLNTQTNGLMRSALGATEATTWSQLLQRFNQLHVGEDIAKSRVGYSFLQSIRGFFNHASSYELWALPMVAERHALREALRARGVGPVGRFFGSLLYDLQRTLSGVRYKSLGTRAIKDNSPMMTRMLGSIGMSFLTFGFAVASAYRAPKETKVSRFFDSLATGLGGFMGFEMGQRLMVESGLMTRFPSFARLCTKHIPLFPRLFGWRPTIGGFIGSVVLPAILGWGISTLFQKPVHWIFGDPDKKEKELKEAALKKQLLQQPSFASEQPNIPSMQPSRFPQTPILQPQGFQTNWSQPYYPSMPATSLYPQQQPIQQPSLIATSRPQRPTTPSVRKAETKQSTRVAPKQPIELKKPSHGLSREELRHNPSSSELDGVPTGYEMEHFAQSLWH